FGANAAKFCSDQGVMREHSLSYVTEEQRRAGQNLARVARSVKSQHALKPAKVPVIMQRGLTAASKPSFLLH
ncbi:MAG: hypothetical protein RIC19_04695, partial [Phaeodactylibacter sp.]|uniref:hypothetical protein n=1 Tax=Phaeodactylibacter sp. TaxID=1940289 RepID=UPI0032EAD474